MMGNYYSAAGNQRCETTEIVGLLEERGIELSYPKITDTKIFEI